MPQTIRVNFSRPVYLTRLQARGIARNVSISYHAINGSSMVYQNAAGIAVSPSLHS